MGLQLTVAYQTDTPEWNALRDLITAKGTAVTVRMIDGMPAFPDEAPDPHWNELRLSTPHGMLTLRKGFDEITCIVWGNASPELQQDQLRIAQAIAELTQGTLCSPRSAH